MTDNLVLAKSKTLKLLPYNWNSKFLLLSGIRIEEHLVCVIEVFIVPTIEYRRLHLLDGLFLFHLSSFQHRVLSNAIVDDHDPFGLGALQDLKFELIEIFQVLQKVLDSSTLGALPTFARGFEREVQDEVFHFWLAILKQV